MELGARSIRGADFLYEYAACHVVEYVLKTGKIGPSSLTITLRGAHLSISSLNG